jgi:hypothetical protein
VTVTVSTEHVAAVNRMTARWLATWGTSSGVLSAAGAWPLIAILAGSADERAAVRLADAAGVDPATGIDAGREVIALLAETDGVDAALGLWTQERARVSPQWRDSVGADTVADLTGDTAADQAALDAWADQNTGGLIKKFPIELHPDVLLVLATAIAMRTTWERAFEPGQHVPAAGPWAGRGVESLNRTTRDLDEVGVAATPAGDLTLTAVAGTNGLDVHLVLGPAEGSAAAILPATVDVVTGALAATSGSTVLETSSGLGPGMRIVEATRPSVKLTTVPFEVTSQHDLLGADDVFALSSVADGGCFSRVAQADLYVSDAQQSAMARFTATGFEAAAVTAIGMRMTSLPVLSAKALEVTYDRPFGFVATHRASGLVLFAGWVAEPSAGGAFLS